MARRSPYNTFSIVALLGPAAICFLRIFYRWITDVFPAPMRPNARALAQAQQRTNLVTGTVLLGFVSGVVYYVTRAVSQDDINDAELEAFKAQREAKAQAK